MPAYRPRFAPAEPVPPQPSPEVPHRPLKPAPVSPPPELPSPAVVPADEAPDPGLPPGLPAHVAATLAKAGERAAQRLLELLAGPRFERFRPSEQRALIELALTRAYGLPVRREVSVNLSSSDSDAVAASLASLAGRPLPEYVNATLRGGLEARNVSPEVDDH